jgi:hypothetical protein
VALTAAVWLVPPSVLPLPSRSGSEGPPRAFGREPGFGAPPAATPRGLARAQNDALLDGPFPRGGLLRGVSEGTLLLDPDARSRELAFQEIAATGAKIVRIPVDWRDTVVEAPRADFDASDPGDRAYLFAPIDAAVRSAAAAGLSPLLVVSHAPAFAEAPHRWRYAYPGSWAPDPTALEAFAAALARRYDGSFPDPLEPGHALPRVRLLQAWNEPNLARYLEPQWVAENGRWSAFSPLLYRQMLNAFYAGVKAVAPSDLVISAGVAPDGDPAGVGRMAPVQFLRALMCLAAGGGRASPGERRACPDPPHFDVLAYHPLSVGDPDAPAGSSLEVAISDAAKITSVLAEAERLHTALPARRKPVWVTELNWQSSPPAREGVPPPEQALWISRALHRLWVAGVSLASWQFLADPYPALRASDPTGGPIEYQRPAGLYSAGPGGSLESAVAKPFLRGFQFPFDPLRVDAHNVRVWALSNDPRSIVVLQRRARAGRWRAIARLHAAPDGVLNALVRMRGAGELRLSSGGLTSAEERIGPRRSAA